MRRRAPAVVALRHCGDGFEIEIAEGERSMHWEKNIRLKIDSVETGPPPGVGVVLRAGMRGDRFSIIFASLADLERRVAEDCAGAGTGGPTSDDDGQHDDTARHGGHAGRDRRVRTAPGAPGCARGTVRRRAGLRR